MVVIKTRSTKGSWNLLVDKMWLVDALRIGTFYLNQTMNCQTVVFLLKKLHSSLLICNQFFLGCSGEWFFYHEIRDNREKSETDDLTSIPQLQRGLIQFSLV